MFKEKRHRPQISNTWVLLAGVCVSAWLSTRKRVGAHPKNSQVQTKSQWSAYFEKKIMLQASSFSGSPLHSLMTVIPFWLRTKKKNLVLPTYYNIFFGRDFHFWFSRTLDNFPLWYCIAASVQSWLIFFGLGIFLKQAAAPARSSWTSW